MGEPCHYRETGTDRPACPYAGVVGVRLTHRRAIDGRRIRTTPRQINLCAVHAEECVEGDLCEMVDMRGRVLQPAPKPDPSPAPKPPPHQRRPPLVPVEPEEALVEEVRAARADLAGALGITGPPPPLCDLVREVVERLTAAPGQPGGVPTTADLQAMIALVAEAQRCLRAAAKTSYDFSPRPIDRRRITR